MANPLEREPLLDLVRKSPLLEAKDKAYWARNVQAMTAEQCDELRKILTPDEEPR